MRKVDGPDPPPREIEGCEGNFKLRRNIHEWSGDWWYIKFQRGSTKAISRSNPEVEDEFQDPWHQNDEPMMHTKGLLSTSMLRSTNHDGPCGHVTQYSKVKQHPPVKAAFEHQTIHTHHPTTQKTLQFTGGGGVFLRYDSGGLRLSEPVQNNLLTSAILRFNLARLSPAWLLLNKYVIQPRHHMVRTNVTLRLGWVGYKWWYELTGHLTELHFRYPGRLSRKMVVFWFCKIKTCW